MKFGSITFWVCRLLSLLLVASSFATFAQNDDEIALAPLPAWVNEVDANITAPVPVDDISDGVYYRLLDTQINVEANGEKQHYNRYIETVTNQVGIESSSQINIDYDPSYQTFELYSLTIWRDGKQLDRFDSAKISVFSREEELVNQIYNGSLTVNILLEDVREGDTIDYSYSRSGANPVFNNIFSYSRSVSWSVPVLQQQIRILWRRDIPLYVDRINSDADIKETKLAKGTEYSVNVENEPFNRYSSQSTGWFSPYGRIYFNQLKNWKEVNDWALTLYKKDTLHPDVKKIADDIAKQTSDRDEQIAKALQFSQKEIRYVGLEMGANSHMPTPANETLDLRYGDCKDKATLLIGILDGLNIDASAALVDTDDTKLLINEPASVRSFNHVIVTLEMDDKRVWLDPTLDYQEGPFSSIYQPDYGYALIVKDGVDSLASMASDSPNSYTHITESYAIPGDPTQSVSFSVKTEYFGARADDQRGRIQRDGRAKMAEDYEIYYQSDHAGLVANSAPIIESSPETGRVTIVENYTISDFWQDEEDGYEMDFYPSDIRNAVYKPKQVNRTSPMWLSYPNNTKFNVNLEFEETGWAFDDESFVEDNKFFYFEKQVSFENNILAIKYDFYTKQDHVAIADFSSYMDARKRLREEAYFGIIKHKKEDVPAKTETDAEVVDSSEQSDRMEITNEMKWGIGVIAILVILILDWRIESGRRPEFDDARFFPMSTTKFLLLSILTMGFYSCYWSYRNWAYLKKRDNLNIMPIARGIFTVFWFYPLFNALKQDSQTRFEKNEVMPDVVAAVFAVVYIIVTLFSSSIAGLTPTLVLLALPLIYLPLLSYVNSINNHANEAFSYNSKWGVRHAMGLILYVPLFAVVLLQSANMMTSEVVIKGEDLPSKDIKFLNRNDIIPASERVQKFYSDGFWSNEEDGNGFTEKTVFSYWQEDDGTLEVETALFSEIASIDTEYAENELTNTVVTVTRHDGSDFYLYVSAIDKLDRGFAKDLNLAWNRSKVSTSD